MEIKRETTLTEALDAIRLLLDQLQNSRISSGDREISGDDRVELEIEIASSDEEFELEFEIKWRAPQASQAKPAPKAPRRKARKS